MVELWKISEYYFRHLMADPSRYSGHSRIIKTRYYADARDRKIKTLSERVYGQMYEQIYREIWLKFTLTPSVN